MELDPAQARQGHDPQLEKVLQVIMEEPAKNPPKQLKHPPYPNYHAKQKGSICKEGIVSISCLFDHQSSCAGGAWISDKQ